MEKVHTLTEILLNLERAKQQVKAVNADRPGNKKRFGMLYWKRAVAAAERAELYWFRKLKDFGKATLIEVTGEILVHSSNPDIQVTRKFQLFMAGVKKEDVVKYLSAQVNQGGEKILLDTIKLKESETGKLIIS